MFVVYFILGHGFVQLLLTLVAGLRTGIGSCIASTRRHTNQKFLSASLGLSAGVINYVSLVVIFMTARDCLTAELGEQPGSWATVGGNSLIAVIHFPERIAVSPLCHAAGSRGRAFRCSFLSGQAEPAARCKTGKK